MSLNNSLANIYKHRNKTSLGKSPSGTKDTLPQPKLAAAKDEDAKRQVKKKKLEELTTKKSFGYRLDELGLRAETYAALINECSLIVSPILPILKRCILVTGQQGVGKTTLINSIATHTKLPLIGCDLAKGMPRSKSFIKYLFQSASQNQPSLLYIDNIDRAYIQSNLASGIADEIISNIIDMEETDARVFILMATKEAKTVDKNLDDHIIAKIELKNPDYDGRVKIINNLINRMSRYNSYFSHLSDEDIQNIAVKTNLYAPTDFVSLFETVKRIFRNRIESCSESQPYVELSDYHEALRRVIPILKQEGFEQIPNVTWDDVGGLDQVREEIRISILNQIRKTDNTDIYYGGILLYGPPGCGKTLVAKAVANEAGLNFISVNSTELMNKYYGETEANISKLFARARQCEPCMIFFDEVDAISGKRPDHESGHSGAKCVQALLTQMDGFKRRGCFVMAATNRLDCIDPAIIRSGRFSKQIRVGLPTQNDRESILKAILRKNPSPNIDTALLAEQTFNFSGADLNLLVEEARLFADDANRPIDMRDFEASKQKIMMYNKNIGSKKRIKCDRDEES